MSNELTPEAVRAAREAAGWSIAQAARALQEHATEPLPSTDTVIRSWKRWEAGVTPNRFYAPLLASLIASVESSEVQGLPDVSGLWWGSWQSWHDRNERIGVQRIRCVQSGDQVRWEALERGHLNEVGEATVEGGGYLWRGELRIWDNRLLMGWYAADDGPVTSKGAVHLVLHPQGQRITGRWIGLSYDGDHETGWGAMARTRDGARTLIIQLREQEDLWSR